MPLEPVPRAPNEESRISTEVAALHDAAFGGRGCSPDTHLVDDVVICVIDLPLLTSEETLLEGGVDAEIVRDARRGFEHSISASLAAVIEHSTGREVVSFFTDARLDPPVTVDLFRLAPAAA